MKIDEQVIIDSSEPDETLYKDLYSTLNRRRKDEFHLLDDALHMGVEAYIGILSLEQEHQLGYTSLRNRINVLMMQLGDIKLCMEETDRQAENRAIYGVEAVSA